MSIICPRVGDALLKTKLKKKIFLNNMKLIAHVPVGNWFPCDTIDSARQDWSVSHIFLLYGLLDLEVIPGRISKIADLFWKRGELQLVRILCQAVHPQWTNDILALKLVEILLAGGDDMFSIVGDEGKVWGLVAGISGFVSCSIDIVLITIPRKRLLSFVSISALIISSLFSRMENEYNSWKPEIFKATLQCWQTFFELVEF